MPAAAVAEGDLEAITEDEERLIERKEQRHASDLGTLIDGLSKREVQILSKCVLQ